MSDSTNQPSSRESSFSTFQGKQRAKLVSCAIIVSLSLVLSAFAACEQDTKLTIEGNPPRFTMKGDGSLRSLRVRGPNRQRSVDGEDAFIYWRLTSEGGTARSVGAIGTITYGSVPTGYTQIYPENGSPPSLVEGERYYVRVDTANANGAEKFFVIKNGKVETSDY